MRPWHGLHSTSRSPSATPAAAVRPAARRVAVPRTRADLGRTIWVAGAPGAPASCAPPSTEMRGVRAAVWLPRGGRRRNLGGATDITGCATTYRAAPRRGGVIHRRSLPPGVAVVASSATHLPVLRSQNAAVSRSLLITSAHRCCTRAFRRPVRVMHTFHMVGSKRRGLVYCADRAHRRRCS